MLLTFFFVFSSCDDKKKEKQKIVKQELKQDTAKIDTVKKEAVIEEVVEEPIPEWPKTITVQKGDWIYDIAREEYGSIYAWRKIYEANQKKISDPDLIYPGQELLLPE